MNEDDVFASMREQLDDITIPEELSVRALSLLDLCVELNKLRTRLYEIGEMFKTKTELGRELHSRRSALIIEINRRGNNE